MQFRDWLVASAGVGLPGARPRPGPVDKETWPFLLASLTAQRITGLALSAIEQGVLTVNEDQHDELHDAHVEAMGNSLRIEQHLVRVANLLEAEGIPLRVLKGSAVAHLDYGDVSMRSFGDADVLLRAEDIDRGLAVLAGAGYRRPAPAARGGFDRRFGKGAYLVADDGYEVDVHRTFAMGPYGYTVKPEDLWLDHDEFLLGDQRIPTLASETRMLHACFHAVVGNPFDRVLPYRDVAEMMLYGKFSWDRTLELAERWQATAVVSRALVNTWDVLSIGTEPEHLTWARAHPPNKREATMLAVYAANTSYAAKSVGSLRVMTWNDRLAFVRLLAGSDRSFARGQSRLRWLLRGTVRAIRDRWPGRGT